MHDSQPDAWLAWLTGPDARRWLAQAATAAEPAGLVRTLRRGLDETQARAVIEQVALRERAQRKFALAGEMFFAPVLLQQASDEWVAGQKAARFPRGQPVWDGCCGLGGDLLTLAERGPVSGLDRSPAAVALARANLEAWRRAGRISAPAEVRVQSVELAAPPADVAWHLDPERRSEGRRTVHLEHYVPGPDVVDRWRRAAPAGAVKLAPATRVPAAWQTEAEFEWISRGGECRQQVAWFGPLAQRPGQRAATVVSRSGTAATFTAPGDPGTGVAERVRAYVFDPDPAVIAAGLVGALARTWDIEALAPGLAYLTGDSPRSEPWAACFAVDDVLPFDRRRLRRHLRAHGIGRLELKQRGLKEDLPKLARELAPAGDAAATLILAGGSGRGPARAILARRVAGEQPT